MTDANTEPVPDTVKPLPDLDDDGDKWRHAPVAPKDKGVIESLGESIPEVVTGSEASTRKGPKT